LTNLLSMDTFIKISQDNYRQYLQEIPGIPGLSLIRYNESEKCNFQYIVVEIDASVAGLHRDVLQKVLHAENVLARRYFWPGCHRMEPYRKLFPDAHLHLHHTEQVAGRVLILPTGAVRMEQEITTICDILRTAIAQADILCQRLASC
jgi:dTDP-4-amino-4,6-dideoxygalactose transaminase